MWVKVIDITEDKKVFIGILHYYVVFFLVCCIGL